LRLATVDIGTNSVLLLVGEIRPDGQLVALEERCTITRLGQGVDGAGALDGEAITRTLEALCAFADEMDALGVDRRAAVGTSALRDATNAEVFLEPAGRALGCQVEVIGGEREAALVLVGVRGGLGALPSRVTLFDVGGGSTELIRCAGAEVEELVSLDLGAVRLTERHLRADPPAPDELAAVEQATAGALQALPPRWGGDAVVGIAGTVTTLATVKQRLDDYDTERVNGSTLSATEVQDMAQRFAAQPLAERRSIVGLDPARADVILAGTLIVSALLARLGAEALTVCDRGVRWGLLRELHQGLVAGGR
jgi:exopolyphosphatase / guanosine-5'-triphosphate,3'-diphosphate pyrophosphatase